MMNPKENDQFSKSESNPDRKSPDPRMPGEESEDIRKGAKQEDQLEKLQPKEEDRKASDQIGSSPKANVNKEE